MDAPRPPLTATLEWDGELQFTGLVGRHEVPMDGSAAAAATPMQMLAFSVAGCMAIDVLTILTRGRHSVSALTTEITAQRADQEPRRFTQVHLHFALAGEMKSEHVERAIQLSRDKYCSVWHSLRQDIVLETTFAIGS